MPSDSKQISNLYSNKIATPTINENIETFGGHPAPVQVTGDPTVDSIINAVALVVGFAGAVAAGPIIGAAWEKISGMLQGRQDTAAKLEKAKQKLEELKNKLGVK